ncbi:MAG TPA: hypothetical protein VGS19_10405 [Streptosporangiaceae bacterium]|nr:hypothetical protein [Streptosporangiaceae bacterium]
MESTTSGALAPDNADGPGPAVLPEPAIPPRAAGTPAWLAALGWVLAGCVLFLCYLRVSRTVPVNSDGAANALQAWDMLHGNLLLHGWWLSDVSFYTTELPEYMLIEAVRGLGADAVHVGGALTYTLLVVLTALLAKGKETGRAAVVRILIAGGIMLAPQVGNAVYNLVLEPDHTGSAVPVLLVLLLLDRARQRWYVPVAVGLILTWALVADKMVLITGVLPIIAVCVARAYRGIVGKRESSRSHWLDLSLAAAALLAVSLSDRVLALLSAAGGFTVWPSPNGLGSFAGVPSHLTSILQGVPLLYGASFFGHNAGFIAALLLLHLAGVVLAAWAVCVVLRRFWSGAGLVDQLLAAAIVVNLVTYLFSTQATDPHSAREFVAVLPLGAALAARVLAQRLVAARLVPLLVTVLAGYVLSLAHTMSVPAAPAQAQQVTTWLSQHNLHHGLSGYWNSSVVTLTSGDHVQVAPVAVYHHTLIRYEWESDASWYDPAHTYANFVVMAAPTTGGLPFPWPGAVENAFGPPARTYTVGRFTVLVWNKNLLTQLP